MESNREESFRCLDLALKARDEGNMTKAAKLAIKSNRLFPTQRAKDLIEELSKPEHSSSRASTGASVAGGSSSNQEGATNVSPDPETLSEINRILSCKNLYGILNVPQDASQPEIKKQYRKLALKFHPDKCTAPRATEAFKAIGRSFGILSDPDKRRRYDVMGDDTGSATQHDSHPFFGEEMDPFDLFANIFMNGDLGGGFLNNGRAYRGYRVHTRTGGTRVYTNFSHQRDQPQPLNLTNILPILPLLFLLLWSIFNSFIYTDSSPYSFQSSRHYSVPRRLGEESNYVYYVHRDFEIEFRTKEAIKNVEHSVISDLLDYFGQKCQREMYVKQQRIMSAKFYQNQEAVDQAQNLATPSCSNVNELQQLRSRG